MRRLVLALLGTSIYVLLIGAGALLYMWRDPGPPPPIHYPDYFPYSDHWTLWKQPCNYVVRENGATVLCVDDLKHGLDEEEVLP